MWVLYFRSWLVYYLERSNILINYNAYSLEVLK